MRPPSSSSSGGIDPVTSPIVAIVNPVSGRGEAAKAWDSVRVRLREPSKTMQTSRPQHAVELAQQALQEGARTIVAVGGDGTISEVVNGFFHQDKLISEAACLAILPYGTGSDFQRAIRVPAAAEEAAALIQTGRPRLIDLMKVRYTGPGGDWASRYCINMISFGMGGIVASRVSKSAKIFGGKVSFVLATIRTAITFGGTAVTIRVNGSKPIDANVTNVAVGNGQYHGGGMLACPGAVLDDGFLDVTLIRWMRLPELVRNLPLLYNGEIHTHHKVQSYRAKTVGAESREPTLIEIDGEAVGRLPVEITVLPRAMRILA